MEFRVLTPGDGREPFKGRSRYEIANNGVLTVYDDDERQTVYGTSGWLKVEVGPELTPVIAFEEHEDF